MTLRQAQGEAAERVSTHFTVAELRCKCCGACDMDPDFIIRLERLRVAYGKPMIINSGYRCPVHNAAVSSTGREGPHTTGRAVDVRVAGEEFLRLFELAQCLGFTGFGVHQKGPWAGRFLHLDDLEPPDFPRPTGWSY